MLSSGPSGFHNAPLSKFILLFSSSFSILSSILTIRDTLSFVDLNSLVETTSSSTTLLMKILPFFKIITTHLFFSTHSELLFGILLIYYWRNFERQMGTAKFASFSFLSFMLSGLVQLSLYSVFPHLKNQTTGPYPFIFACFVQFYFDIPATYRFRLCGINANDKLFAYILGAQLLMSNYPSSALCGLYGILSGLVYRSDTLRMNRLRFPAIVNSFCRRFILPLLQSPPTAHLQNRNLNVIAGSADGNTNINNGNNNGNAPRNPISGPRTAINRPGVQHRNGNGQVISEQMLSQALSATPLPNQASEESIELLTSMGFSRDRVIQALARCHNDIQLATNVLLDQH